MAPSIDTTLLALLLALSNLDTLLSPTEQAALKQAGEQLDANPKGWSVIEKGLMKVVESNNSLHQQYQAAIALLDATGGKIPTELLPSESELEEVLRTGKKLEKRPYKPKSPEDSQNNEILNISTKVLNTPNPAEATQKLPWGKLKEFLKTALNK